MRRWSWEWRLILLGGLLLSGPLQAGDKPGKKAVADNEEKKDSWMSRWFGPEEKKPAEIPPAEKPSRRKRVEANQPSVKAQELAHAQEEAAFLRRLAVCDRLKEIAVETKDDALLKEAEELSQKAWVAYSQQAHQAPMVKNLSKKDKQILEKHLGPGAGERKGGKQESAAGGKSQKQRAAVKEDER